MNRLLILHVVERLEAFVGRLPATIQKPILSELTPLKELFLQQRPPRFIVTGPAKSSLSQAVALLFPGFRPGQTDEADGANDLWEEFKLADRGTVFVIDARTDPGARDDKLKMALQSHPADIILFLVEDDRGRLRKSVWQDLVQLARQNDQHDDLTKIVGAIMSSSSTRRKGDAKPERAESAARLRQLLVTAFPEPGRVLGAFSIGTAPEFERQGQTMMMAIARALPNEARIEIARISGDKEAQAEIAQLLVKSTTAICTAIGAQPIPLADLPILTTLQLVMVSGIMYLSGREKSLRAATEFVGALGANVGAGMLLRQGTRAILKFFPGWGNVVSGMVAGAGTYAIGRAAIAYFLEGVSLQDARRTFLTARKRPTRAAIVSRSSQSAADLSRERKGRKPLRLRRG